ncbi:MAG: serine/threonine-protein kinase [Myxococcota bacterium]
MSLVGRHIGRYRILEQLGQGGMSVVYKGLDTALDREVAVKVLHPHLSGKEESRKRLAREAKAVAKLHHPNILEVFDFAAAEAEDAYIVTEYIRGQTLRQYAAGQTFEPPEIAAMVIHEVAAALAHAHEANIIHRDLKPENVMVRDDGVLKLMDFGIAKIIDRDEKMTMTGALVGSPAHMAPEIIEGDEAGPEADVFSLGTMLYLFATTRLPFTAPNTTATLKRILDGVYDDPRQLVPTVSDELADIIATCLMRQPSQRYPNAGKLRDALSDHLASLGFPRVSEELVSFFADPPSYRKQMVKRLTEALVKKGERFIAEKRPAKALSCLNQVLALDAGNLRAHELLEQMNLSKQRQLRAAKWTRVGVAAAVIALVAAAIAQVFHLATRVDDFLPHLRRGTDVAVLAKAYPPLPPVPSELPPVETLVPSSVPLVVEPAMSVTPARVQVAKAESRPSFAAVDVVVNVRPWGSVKVNGEAKSPNELPRHVLKLVPGKYKLTIGCERFCTEGGITREIEVGASKTTTVLVPAPLRASSLSFFGFPPEAMVTVGTEQRTVRQSQEQPFTIEMPREGSPRMEHKVRYAVTLAGYRPAEGTKVIAPGVAEQIGGSLERE